MDLCGSCGRVAPQTLAACELCGASFGRVPARGTPEDLRWAALRSEFQCRSCGHHSPIDHLDTDGSASCRRCGLEQAFAVESWRLAIEHAHAVADLAGPDPEGSRPHPQLSIAAENPYWTIGVGETEAAAKVVGGPNQLRVRVGPGQPLCPRCKSPYSVFAEGPGVLALECGACPRRRYAIPPEARSLHPALVGAVAEAHDCEAGAGLGPAATGGAAQAVAIRCPGCGAPLQGARPGSIVTCNFCHSTAQVPASAGRSQQLAPAVEAATWWLLLRGPSQQRRALEHAPEAAGWAGQHKAEAAADSEELALEQPELADPPRLLSVAVGLALPLLLLAAVAALL